jgi:hypothetical protein
MFVNPSNTTIKPEKGFHNLLPWLLAPFANGSKNNEK